MITSDSTTPDVAELGSLYAALAAAQGEFTPIAKNRSVKIQMKAGGTYQFRYADLEAILSATRPALAKNGLAFFQLVRDVGDKTYLSTCIAHASGQKLEASIELPAGGDDPKAYGATVTYYRRYAATAMLGVAADDDLDENGEPALDAPSETLLTNAQAASTEGMAALSAFLNQCTQEQRNTLKAHLVKLKEGAAAFDADMKRRGKA